MLSYAGAPSMEKKMFFTIPSSKLSKIEQNQPKLKSRKAYPKKYQNLNFLNILASQTFPKTPPNLSQIRRAAGSARRAKSYSIYALINMDLSS